MHNLLVMSTLKHGHAHRGKPSPTYNSWQSMLRRCYNSTSASFKYYGAKGVKVCKRWRRFSNFLKDMGVRPKKKTLARIDHNGHYNLENCTWETPKEQARKRSSNTRFSVGGFNGCLAELCERFLIDKATVIGRLRLGWTVEKAFLWPKRKIKRL